MERAYCQNCRKEIPTESGMLCQACGDEIARTERRVLADPGLRGFCLGIAAGLAFGVLLGLGAGEHCRRQTQAAWDEDVMAWEAHATEQYERGWADGAKIAELHEMAQEAER